MKRYLLILFAVMGVILGTAACGGGSPRVITSPAGAKLKPPHAQVKLSSKCPTGKSFMGCSTGGYAYSLSAPPPGASHRPLPKLSGSKFPDVSSYQGCSISWSRIPVQGAIVKAWEYSEDPCLPHNATSLRSAHKKWTMYDFVRYCNASSFIRLYNQYRPPLPAVIDEEVSQSANCTGPLAVQIHNQSYNHTWPIEYNSPGTAQPGASAYHLKGWFASYGASHAPCEWTCPVAWQFASPPFVYYRISGLGYGDVSVDMGLLELSSKPAPPKLICFGKKARLSNSTCKKVRADVARWRKAAASSKSVYVKRNCPTLAHRISWYSNRIRRYPGSRLTPSRKRALHSNRTAYRQRSCAVFAGRNKYFNGKANSTIHKYS